MKLLLDSVIIIDHFNGIHAASDFIIKNQKKSLYISIITRTEVLCGFNDLKKLAAAKKLLDHFQLLNITKTEADMAAELRQQHKWKLPDALQVALAKNYKMKLITRNTKDFDPKKHTFVFIPYSICP